MTYYLTWQQVTNRHTQSIPSGGPAHLVKAEDRRIALVAERSLCLELLAEVGSSAASVLRDFYTRTRYHCEASNCSKLKLYRVRGRLLILPLAAVAGPT